MAVAVIWFSLGTSRLQRQVLYSASSVNRSRSVFFCGDLKK